MSASSPLGLASGATEGSIEFRLKAKFLLKRNVVLTSVRENHFGNSDFSSPIYPTTHVPVTQRMWLTHVADGSSAAAAGQLSDGTPAVQLQGLNSNLGQGVYVAPGEKYVLSYRIDASSLEDGVSAETFMRYHPRAASDGIGQVGNISYPLTGSSTRYTLTKLTSAAHHGVINRAARILIPDCVEHGVSEYGFSYTHFSPPSGSTCEDGIGVLFLGFQLNGSGGATYSNLRLEREDQIQTDIVSIPGEAGESETVLYSSTLDRFMIESLGDGISADTPLVLRIRLKAHSGVPSPKLSGVTLADSMRLTLKSTTSTKEASSVSSLGASRVKKSSSRFRRRLMAAEVLGAKSDYDDASLPIRAQCLDPFSGSLRECRDLFEEYKAGGGGRFNLYTSFLRAKVNASGDDYDFELTSDNGELLVQRAVEKADSGYQFIGMLVRTGGVKFNLPTDDKPHEVDVNVWDLPDLSGGRKSSWEVTQSRMQSIARVYARLFNGSTRRSVSGITRTLPKFEQWEVYNEDNITHDWDDEAPFAGLSQSEIVARRAQLQYQVASVVRAEIPGAKISFSGPAVRQTVAFNIEDLNSYLGALTSSERKVFNLANFHSYMEDQPLFDLEARFDQAWSDAKSALAGLGLSAAPIFIGEYGRNHSRLRSDCALNSDGSQYAYNESGSITAWSRPAAADSQSFVSATLRDTILLLSKSVERVLYYGFANFARESHGQTLGEGGSGGYECFDAHALYSFSLFDMLQNYGKAAGRSDEASRFQANAGGKAYLTMARLISESSPKDITATALDSGGFAGANEIYGQRLFEVDGGVVLALWWYRPSEFGAPYMNMQTGAVDTGFTGRRRHELFLEGSQFLGYREATLIRADGSSEALRIQSSRVGTSGLKISGVSYGEQPVFVQLR